jgi:hypothetical protein
VYERQREKEERQRKKRERNREREREIWKVLSVSGSQDQPLALK